MELSPQVLTREDLNEVLSIYRKLLQIDTTNPTSSEKKGIEYIKKLLDREKIPYKVFEPQKERCSLIAFLEGKEKDTFLLSSHIDTVPFEEEGWEYPPLSAKEEGGYIYGRGAIDMKHFTAQSIFTLIKLKRERTPIRKSLMVAVFADEEQGGEWGSKWIVKKYPSLFRHVSYALNEVGGFPIYFREKPYFLIQKGEKGYMWVEVEFFGRSAHSSLEPLDNANYLLGEALIRLKKKKVPLKLSPLTRKMIEELLSSSFYRFFPSLGGKLLSENRFFYAMFHDTFTPTMISSSKKMNVTPFRSTLYIDIRILPSSSKEEILSYLKKILPTSEISLLSYENGFFVEDSSFSTFLEEELKKEHPLISPLGYLLPGFSDSHYLYSLGIQVYGFTPFYFPEGVDVFSLFHAEDERMYIKGFLWGVDFLYRVVKKWLLEK